MIDDPFAALGLTNPVHELAQLIHDTTNLGPDDRWGPLDQNAALAVYEWHRIRTLDLEHVITAMQDWADVNTRSAQPDWASLRRILTGDRLEDQQ